MRRSILYVLFMQCFIHGAENPEALEPVFMN